MEIFLIHVCLGIVLFFIVNWIGKHSYSIGYMEISIFVQTEEAPALNFLIRVLTPVVYIIIISAILYNFGFDKYVRNIYWVNIYYITFRLTFNLVTNRGLLLNWYRQVLYWFAIIVVSFFTYEKVIKEKENILPDFSTVANELWIIILIFIFQITNNLRFSQEATKSRKENYLKQRYYLFKGQYGRLIKEITNNEFLEVIVYAVMIYEDFNRPKIARIIENIRFMITKKPHTLGVMQVKSTKMISDIESVKLGAEKIVNAYKDYIEEYKEKNQEIIEWHLRYSIIQDYNSGDRYCDEVDQLAEIIESTFYKDSYDKSKDEKQNDLK